MFSTRGLKSLNRLPAEREKRGDKEEGVLLTPLAALVITNCLSENPLRARTDGPINSLAEKRTSKN